MRAPFQVLVIPYLKEGNEFYYAIFKRQDLSVWQAIAGGGEDQELPLETAQREAQEEAGIDPASNYLRLASLTTIPAANIGGLNWEEVIMIPEIAFGVEVTTRHFTISHEHSEYGWFSLAEASAKLKYDSNKSALWELDYRLKNDLTDITANRDNVRKYY